MDSTWFASISDPVKFEALPNSNIHIASDKTNSTIPIEASSVDIPKSGRFIKIASDTTDSAIAIEDSGIDWAKSGLFIKIASDKIVSAISIGVSGIDSLTGNVLRELMPNASDALDSGRHESLTVPDTFVALPESYIKIASDRTPSAIAIEDSGICVTKNELRELMPNASDDLDSSRHESIRDPDRFMVQPSSYFKIASDKINSAIAIEDSGTCATENELRELNPNAFDAQDISWCDLSRIRTSSRLSQTSTSRSLPTRPTPPSRSRTLAS